MPCEPEPSALIRGSHEHAAHRRSQCSPASRPTPAPPPRASQRVALAPLVRTCRAPNIKRTESGPGSYNPKKAFLMPHRPMPHMQGKPVPSSREEDGSNSTGPSVGPGTHFVPDRPLDTTPAGRSFPAFAFARRQYMPPSVDPEQRLVLLAKSTSDAQLHKVAVTREGMLQQQARKQDLVQLRESRSASALVRKARIDGQREDAFEQARQAR
eukprot:3295905-Prymnesium_polylepis.1